MNKQYPWMEENPIHQCKATIEKRLVTVYIGLRCLRSIGHEGNHMILFNEERDGSTPAVPLQWSDHAPEKQESSKAPAEEGEKESPENASSDPEAL